MASDSEQTRPMSPGAQALKDTVHYLRNREFWLLCLAACLLSGFAGPFGTNSIMPLALRMLFWAVVMGLSILLLTYLSFLAHRINLRLGYHWSLAAAAAGAAGALVIYPVVAGLYWTLMPGGPALAYVQTFFEVLVPAVVVNVIVNAYVRLPADYADPRTPALAQVETRPDPTITAPLPEDQSLFFELLPPEIGREVVSIRADNHYVEVHTTLGMARVLMRLRDAEATLSALPGLRVHRSWWVNMEHVTALATRPGGGGQVTLDTGTTVPVSRPQIAEVARVLADRQTPAA